MNFEWILFSVDPATIRGCCAAGIHGIIVDWENRGKHERQTGFDTQINLQTIEDLRRARLATPANHRLFCRINGWHANSPREIDEAIDNGADELFLPMVRTPREVEWTLRLIDDRVPLGILIETRDAVECARELANLPLSRIYVGLNDLSIDYGNDSLFEALHDGTVDTIRERIPASMPFGIAGMTMPELGRPVPARLLACEIARLGATFTFLRRSFLRDIKGRDPKQEVPRMLAAIEAARNRDAEQIVTDCEEFAVAVQSTVQVLKWRNAAV